MRTVSIGGCGGQAVATELAMTIVVSLVVSSIGCAPRDACHHATDSTAAPLTEPQTKTGSAQDVALTFPQEGPPGWLVLHRANCWEISSQHNGDPFDDMVYRWLKLPAKAPCEMFSDVPFDSLAAARGQIQGLKTVEHYPLHIGSDGIELGETIYEPLISRSYGGQTHHHGASSQSGPYVYITRGQSHGTGAEIVRHHLPSLDAHSFENQPPYYVFDGTPTAVLAAGEQCLIGSTGAVSVADFSGEHPTMRQIFHSDIIRKPVDFFLADGDGVLAVDDVIRPFYAIFFPLEEGSWLGRGEGLALPALINAHYLGGVAHKGRYYLHAAFHHRGGKGRELWDIEIADLPEARYPNNDEHTVFGPRIEPISEYLPSPSNTTSATTLLGGAAFSPWRGLAVVSDTLLIGAERRGVLMLDLPLTDQSKAQTFEVGGDVLDLHMWGKTAVALVTEESSAQSLVFLTPSKSQNPAEPKIKVTRRIPLDQVANDVFFDRIVR